MQFKLLSLLATAAALVSANSVTFMSQDSIERTIYFTGNPGMETIPPTTVPAGASVKVSFADNWTGNFYAVSEGASIVPGMLGEVAFQAWGALTFFDVSAIVNPNDKNGVKEMWPSGSTSPKSGCRVFPCDTAYYLPDDIQTKSTDETDLVCTLGTGSLDTREVEVDNSPVFVRGFVLGQWTGRH